METLIEAAQLLFRIKQKRIISYFSLGEEDLRIMKCEKGSVMLEILVSLSLLMMTVSLLLPQTLLIMQERKNIQLRYKAQLFLKEAAAVYMYHHVISPVIEKQYENVTYTIQWQTETVCVRWKDMKQREIERCRYVKK